MGMKQVCGDVIGKLVSSMPQVSGWTMTAGMLQHWPDLLWLLLQVVVKASSGIIIISSIKCTMLSWQPVKSAVTDASKSRSEGVFVLKKKKKKNPLWNEMFHTNQNRNGGKTKTLISSRSWPRGKNCLLLSLLLFTGNTLSSWIQGNFH